MCLFSCSIFWKSKYTEHNFSILTDRKSEKAPATQEFYLYLSMICQNSKYVKKWNHSFNILIFYWTLSKRGPKLTIQRVKKTCATYFGHFSGFVFKICLWISIFGRKKQFENRIFSCWDIKQTKLLIFFLYTLYLLWKSAVCNKKKLWSGYFPNILATKYRMFKSFFLLKIEIHRQILNTKPFLCN